MTDVEAARLTAWVHGRVQGAGMRWWIRARALELGLVGWARNTDDGRVEIVAEGDRAAQKRLLAALTAPADEVDRPGRVTNVTERWSAARGGLSGFTER